MSIFNLLPTDIAESKTIKVMVICIKNSRTNSLLIVCSNCDESTANLSLLCFAQHFLLVTPQILEARFDKHVCVYIYSIV